MVAQPRRAVQVARCDERFRAALASKLLTYASGRTLGPLDHAEVERIVAELAARGNGLRDLVELVVESRVFRTR